MFPICSGAYSIQRKIPNQSLLQKFIKFICTVCLEERQGESRADVES